MRRVGGYNLKRNERMSNFCLLDLVAIHRRQSHIDSSMSILTINISFSAFSFKLIFLDQTVVGNRFTDIDPTSQIDIHLTADDKSWRGPFNTESKQTRDTLCVYP
jgi:hypothetical protein